MEGKADSLDTFPPFQALGRAEMEAYLYVP